MKKSILALGMSLVMLVMTASVAYAQENVAVTFTADNKLVYENVVGEGEMVDLGDAFRDIAPGETRSQVITVKNSNKMTADFYMSAEAVKSLERGTESARGAGYEMHLSVGDKVLYDSAVGGYTGSEEDDASTEGIEEMNKALEDYILIATLEKGQSVDVVFTIAFDGEAMDNNALVDYSGATGQLAFDFKVGYEDPTGIEEVIEIVQEKKEPQVIKKVVEIIERVPLAAVATGDNALIGAGVLVLAAGIVLIVVGSKKKEKTEEKS